MTATKNPNPVVTVDRKTKPLQQAYNLDNSDPGGVVKDLIRKEFTKTIFEGSNDVIAKVLTDASVANNSNPNVVSVRGRVRKVHDYLPIPQGPVDESTAAGRLEMMKVFLHPEFVSDKRDEFSGIGPGTEIVAEMQYPDVPFEYSNGTIKGKFVRGLNVFGLKASSQFKACADYLPPSSVLPAKGSPQPGSQNPGSTQPTVMFQGQAMTRDQVIKNCNSIYNLGKQKPITTVSDISEEELKQGMELIAGFEGFLPTLRAGFDKGYDSIGFGTLMSGPPKLAGKQPAQVRDYLIKQPGMIYDRSQNKLIAAPKSVWKNYAHNKKVPGNYTSITKEQAFEIMKFTQLKPKIIRIRNMLKGTKIKLADHQVMAIMSFSYQMGRLDTIVGFLKTDPTPTEIYAFFVKYGSKIIENGKHKDFSKYLPRRQKEAEYFFGNKNYKK